MQLKKTTFKKTEKVITEFRDTYFVWHQTLSEGKQKTQHNPRVLSEVFSVILDHVMGKTNQVMFNFQIYIDDLENNLRLVRYFSNYESANLTNCYLVCCLD
jgi:hypothetical protein